MKSKFILLLALLFFPLGKGTFSQTDVNNAQAIFIYNFLSHIKWPDNATNNGYTIGVLGNTSTTKYLQTYTANRKVGSKPIKVVQYQSVNEINNCQVLFIAYGKTGQISTISKKLGAKPCLIIGERDGAIQAGAAINFKIVSGRLRYQLDKSKAETHQLYISNALVQMAI